MSSKKQKKESEQLENGMKFRSKMMLDHSLFIFRECLIQYMLIVKEETDDQKITNLVVELGDIIHKYTGKTAKEIITT